MEQAIEKTGPITALGAMSGTSLDGVDAAIVVTDGVTIDRFGATAYKSYSAEERAVLASALGHWQGTEVDAATAVIEHVHRAVLADFPEADVIGFHGQTLAHAPHTRGTLQVGDGAWLATALDRPVVWDFRTADVEMGGEGAPLAPFFHFACAKYIGATRPLAFLNLGGVGNLTYVDPSFDQPEAAGALLAFDTGPANAPINDLVQARLGLPYDRDGQIAREGSVEINALDRFLAEPYFARIPPKSLDRNDFSQMMDQVGDLQDADAAATLTAMSAAAVREGLRYCPQTPTQLLVTGGGRNNPVLMEMLRSTLACPVKPVEDVGLDGDMLEAQAFAYLSVRVARGLPTSCPGTTGVRTPVAGGTISYPNAAAVAVHNR
ncbi:anhydro-N-acetylmuramic acid kinase [Roseobacter sp. OBYS 0001]|uniref:anhydro-N-acetylmuramic acid kinase n=1 Tax=Roseobacter sp. OBYS 0001 TaxID=882651 RepID=UPI001BBBDF8E|nr:anhydro-N-acetylmuramic acid kinase [Roseobacter sp. OBYS 0001]GIT87218.1 anhydro-N-acetylmuramic acid kinase [Roseobacter sp. OBYS 0001]